MRLLLPAAVLAAVLAPLTAPAAAALAPPGDLPAAPAGSGQGPPQAPGEPYVQSEPYLLTMNCCTFDAREDDAAMRLRILDALAPAGLVPGARVELHDADHRLLRALWVCGESPETALPPGTAHVHVYLLGPLDNPAVCGPAAGPGATAGTVELRMNGA